MDCSVAHIVRAANAPTQRHFLGWAIAPIHTFFFLLRDYVLGFMLMAAALLTATACCFFVIAALSMTVKNLL